jgi:hypothetical protein
MARISTPEPGSCQLDIPHASLEQIPSARGSDQNVPTAPREGNPSNDVPTQSNWLAKYRGISRPTVEVKFEQEWTNGFPVASVKFSADGRYLAAGLAQGGEKTYIYAWAYQVGMCKLSFSSDGRYRK